MFNGIFHDKPSILGVFLWFSYGFPMVWGIPINFSIKSCGAASATKIWSPSWSPGIGKQLQSTCGCQRQRFGSCSWLVQGGAPVYDSQGGEQKPKNHDLIWFMVLVTKVFTGCKKQQTSLGGPLNCLLVMARISPWGCRNWGRVSTRAAKAANRASSVMVSFGSEHITKNMLQGGPSSDVNVALQTHEYLNHSGVMFTNLAQTGAPHCMIIYNPSKEIPSRAMI